MGSSPPGAVLSHGAETRPHSLQALPRCGQATGRSSLPSAAAAGTPLETTDFCLSQLGLRKTRFLFVPRLQLSRGLVTAVPLPWAKGNRDPSATAQSHRAQLLLLTVLTPRLLTLGFIGAGAFPAVRLPLLVQAADADSLPPADRDVLLHEARQHACGGGGRQTCPRWSAGTAQARAQPKTYQRAPSGTIKSGHEAETCGPPD